MDKDYLLQKWLNNDLSEDDKLLFEQLDDYKENKIILDVAQEFKASEHSKATTFEDFKKNHHSIDTPVIKLNWTQYILRIAGVFIFAFGIYFTFVFNQLIEIQTLASEKITVELPDASLVTLNADSEIAFSERRWNKKRHVDLEGEAYFKVAKGKTFDIETEDGVVSVIGTEFNVKQRDDYFEVQCFEGLVQVISDTIQRKLKAGDSFQILNGKFSQSSINNDAPSWTKNLSQFSALPFSEVINEMERQFDIRIKIDDRDKNRLFTGGFNHDNLESALIAVTQPLNLTYKMDTSNHVVIHAKKE